MKIGIGNDHSAVEMKQDIAAYLEEKGYEVVNYGTDSHESCDYPVYGEKVGRAVAAGDVDFGIVICGTGLGISLAANKVRGIRAVVCSEPYTARLARQHNDANVLIIDFSWSILSTFYKQCPVTAASGAVLLLSLSDEPHSVPPPRHNLPWRSCEE